MGLPLGSVPRTPLLVPVSTHRDVTRVPSSFWNVSMASTRRTLTWSTNSPIQLLTFSLPEIAWPPASTTMSSARNRSAASGSCAFQTSSQNAVTSSVDRMVATIPLASTARRSFDRWPDWTSAVSTVARRIRPQTRHYVIVPIKIPMCSESVRPRRRDCEVVHCARPIDNTARLVLDTVAAKPSAPPRRSRPPNDAAPHDAVRAHWREVVRRARPVDTTERFDLDIETTARLDPDTVVVKPSAPPRRSRPPHDAAPHDALGAHWREVVRGARPVDT